MASKGNHCVCNNHLWLGQLNRCRWVRHVYQYILLIRMPIMVPYLITLIPLYIPYHTWYIGRPEAWQHDDVRVQFKHIVTHLQTSPKAKQNRPMAIFLLKMAMTTIRVIKFIIFLKNDDNFIGKISCILLLEYFIYSGTVHVGIKLIKCLTNMRFYIIKLWWTADVPNTIMTKPTQYVHMSIMI